MQYVMFHSFFAIISNGASISGFKSVLIVWLWLHNFLEIRKIFLEMIYNYKDLHKMLNYAFLQMQAQQEWEMDAAVCFSLYFLRNWTQQLC